MILDADRHVTADIASSTKYFLDSKPRVVVCMAIRWQSGMSLTTLHCRAGSQVFSKHETGAGQAWVVSSVTSADMLESWEVT